MALALLSASFRAARTGLSEWAATALDLAFPKAVSAEAAPVQIEPPFCRQCGYPYPALSPLDSTFLCAACARQKWHFLWARAGYRTEGQVREAIVDFKYHQHFHHHEQLVQWLAAAFDHHAASEWWDALVPVPLYHRRRRERGFNQALEVARGLAKARHLNVMDCLYRYRETISQTKLRRNARRENMTGAFRLKRGFDVTGFHLLLIDDVFTTGATANACAQALVGAGARSVAVLTIARS